MVVPEQMQQLVIRDLCRIKINSNNFDVVASVSTNENKERNVYKINFTAKRDYVCFIIVVMES